MLTSLKKKLKITKKLKIKEFLQQRAVSARRQIINYCLLNVGFPAMHKSKRQFLPVNRRARLKRFYKRYLIVSRKIANSRLFSYHTNLVGAIRFYKRRLFTINKYVSMRRLRFGRLVSAMSDQQKFFVKSLKRRFKRKRADRRIFYKRTGKKWLIKHAFGIFVKLYKKNLKNKLNLPFTYREKFQKKLKIFLKKNPYNTLATDRKLSFLFLRLKRRRVVGCHASDFSMFRARVTSTEWPRKFVKEYLTAFSPSGKLIGSAAGLYYAIYKIVVRNTKKRRKRFIRRYDAVLRRDIIRLNRKARKAANAILKLSTIVLEERNPRFGELWYYKNSTRRHQAYRRNIPTKKIEMRLDETLSPTINQEPFTLFGTDFKFKAYTQKYVTEGMFDPINFKGLKG